MLELPPDHLIHHADVGLDDADHLGGDVFVYIVGDGEAGEAVADERDGDVHALQQALGVDARKDKAALVESFRPLGTGADADGREGMADGGEEARFFRQRTRVRHYAEGIHLQAVVVVEAEGLVLDDAGVELETGGLKALTTAWMTTI